MLPLLSLFARLPDRPPLLLGHHQRSRTSMASYADNRRCRQVQGAAACHCDQHDEREPTRHKRRLSGPLGLLSRTDSQDKNVTASEMDRRTPPLAPGRRLKLGLQASLASARPGRPYSEGLRHVGPPPGARVRSPVCKRFGLRQKQKGTAAARRVRTDHSKRVTGPLCNVCRASQHS